MANAAAAPTMEASPLTPTAKVNAKEALAGVSPRRTETAGLKLFNKADSPEQALVQHLKEKPPQRADVLTFLEDLRNETASAPVTQESLRTLDRIGSMVGAGGALENSSNPQKAVAESIAQRRKKAVQNAGDVLSYSRLQRLQRENGLKPEDAIVEIYHPKGPDGKPIPLASLSPEQQAAIPKPAELKQRALLAITENPVFKKLIPEIVGDEKLSPTQLADHIDKTLAAAPHLEVALERYLSESIKEAELLAEITIPQAEKDARVALDAAKTTRTDAITQIKNRIATTGDPIANPTQFDEKINALLANPNVTVDQVQDGLIDAYLGGRGMNTGAVRALETARAQKTAIENAITAETGKTDPGAADRMKALQARLIANQTVIDTNETALQPDPDSQIAKLDDVRNRMKAVGTDGKTLVAWTGDMLSAQSTIVKNEQMLQTAEQKREGEIQSRLNTESKMVTAIEKAMGNAIIDTMYEGARVAAIAKEDLAIKAAEEAAAAGLQREADAMYAVERTMATRWIEWTSDPKASPIVNEDAILGDRDYLALCGRTKRADQAVPRMILGDLYHSGQLKGAFYDQFATRDRRTGKLNIDIDKVNLAGMPPEDKKLLDTVVEKQGELYLTRLLDDYRAGQEGAGLNFAKGALRRIAVQLKSSDWAIQNNELHEGLAAFEPQMMKAIEGDAEAQKIMKHLNESGADPKLKLAWLAWLAGGIGVAMLAANPLGLAAGLAGAASLGGTILGGGMPTAAAALAAGGAGAAISASKGK
jgi:hypothetical protein